MLEFSQTPESICILRLSAIGDVTHILPIIHTLQKVWPQTKITWVIGKLEYGLVKSLADIEFIVFEKSDGWRAYHRLRRQFKARRFDLLLMMQTSLRASLASLCIPARYKLGFDKQRAINFQWLFSNCAINGEHRVHVLDGFFQFLQALAINERCLQWDLPIAAADLNYARKISDQQAYVVINPCSSIRRNNWRNWSGARYAEIIDYLADKQLRVILTGGPSAQELEIAQSITGKSNAKPINLVGQTSLDELLALLKEASFVIAPDTGPAHMATVANTPVIGLYASSNPQRTGPYNGQSSVVNRYPDALMKFKQKTVMEACWGERVRDPRVMTLITVADVKYQIDQLLLTRPGKNGRVKLRPI